MRLIPILSLRALLSNAGRWVFDVLPLPLPLPSYLPAGLCVVEILGHLRMVGYVRALPAGYVEVLVEAPLRPSPDHVTRRVFGPAAIREIRGLTVGELRAREEEREQASRPCRHCGKVECRAKGTTAEDSHICSETLAETWCGSRPALDTRVVTPAEARVDLERVTCSRCRAALLDAPVVLGVPSAWLRRKAREGVKSVSEPERR